MSSSAHEEINAIIDKELEEPVWDIASKVWGFAELGYREFKSSAIEQEALEKVGFEISDRGIGGCETSWIATHGSGSPVLGLLCEFDALPGLGNDLKPEQTPCPSGNTSGHGCGHNLIGTASIGAAIALKKYMEKNKVPGTLRVFGCPAEEMLNGKNYMSNAGAFKSLDVCLHNHPGPITTCLNFHSTASIDLWIEFHGKTAHAGVSPWEGRSALQAAEIFLVAANMMREHILPTARMHYIIEKGGAAVNVVPDYARVLFRYRDPSAENVREHVDWVKDIAKGAALATQTKSEVTNLGGIYDCIPNDAMAKHMMTIIEKEFPLTWTDEEQDYAKKIQKAVGKEEKGMATTVLPVPTGVEMGGSSDVGDVSWNVPTMGLVYSTWPLGIPPHHWGCVACHGMSIGRKGLHAAMKVLACTGIDYLTNPDLLKEAKEDFEKHTKGLTYKSLNETETPQLGVLEGSARSHYACCIHMAAEYFDAKYPDASAAIAASAYASKEVPSKKARRG
mmetsp:Transcript_23508/g.62280  ORF Transcript_23508/g.62280 Transcript_23508/m.62280 type:complete len:506 (-) Transcript_23508:187-1704(-)|eukprot:CAMPEP_0174908626 /NCGR_PEP_ID=MMETSP0167-20121228/65296_1 /TAXON_ID=38298 /ORGANISM="Rhodella maculata, Strain CCMP736" /LENGTH=505 /DNA_ID=CAMNT_0016152419 /DNA_START=9 /DNA_END=1526 /DNA_ORIENTATION=-